MVLVLRKTCCALVQQGRQKFISRNYERILKSNFILGLTYKNLIMGTSSSRSYSPKNTQRKGGDCTENRGTISRMESTGSEFVENVVCKEDDLQDNEMKVVNVGDGKVLLVKQKGTFYGLGTACTHYGAPLEKGALGDGRIRCPWHGACFNIKTGDIEDFPGFDSLPCYNVSVSEQGEVKVRARVSDLKSNKRTKNLYAESFCDLAAVVIIGGGPSGATCAETLRAEGFRGRISLITKENYLPYDRPKVSKLSTIGEIEKLQARSEEYYRNAKIEIFRGVEATKIDKGNNIIHLSNGVKIQYSAVYVATGSSARVPNIPGANLENVFTMRTFDDSVNILTALGENKDKHVVVLGLGFIGLEAAAAYCGKAASMTVVGKDMQPLRKVFGKEIGKQIQKLFEEHDVKFHFETTISEITDEEGVIKSVILENETELPADIVIFGIGTTFNTKFLKDCDIQMVPSGAVSVNNKLETSEKNIYAGGDIAHAPVFAYGNGTMTIGHIGLAQYHGRVAALNILKKETILRTVPYFWTTIFGKSIRYAGCGNHANTVVVGDIEAMKFVVFFLNAGDKVIAVASCMWDPVVSQFAELLHQGKSIYKDDLEPNPFDWVNNLNDKTAVEK